MTTVTTTASVVASHVQALSSSGSGSSVISVASAAYQKAIEATKTVVDHFSASSSHIVIDASPKMDAVGSVVLTDVISSTLEPASHAATAGGDLSNVPSAEDIATGVTTAVTTTITAVITTAANTVLGDSGNVATVVTTAANTIASAVVSDSGSGGITTQSGEGSATHSMEQSHSEEVDATWSHLLK